MKTTLLLPLVLLAAAPLSTVRSVGPRPTDGPRQFDFWVGSWECRTPSGQLAGTNTIRKILKDRVLEESWKGAGGSNGKSLNIYDAATKSWHQTWVDDSGLLLQLDGGIQDDGSMLMEGTRPGPGGSEVLHRITWTPLEGGKVRQRWDTSSDGGDSWSSLADLVYSPVAEEADAEGDR